MNRPTQQPTNGYTLLVIEYGENSPMDNHLGGEVAVDEANKTMYVHETFMVTYGADSIVKSCNSY